MKKVISSLIEETRKELIFEAITEKVYMTPGFDISHYAPLPLFILKTEISHAAKLLYALLLNRARLSQQNGWVDAEQRIYLIYTIENMAKDMNCCKSTIKNILNELEGEDLIARKKRGLGRPNYLYVKVPMNILTKTQAVPSSQEKTRACRKEDVSDWMPDYSYDPGESY